MVRSPWSLCYPYISKLSNKLLCILNQVFLLLLHAVLPQLTEILKIRSNSKATGSFLKTFKKHWQIIEKIRLQKSFKFKLSKTHRERFMIGCFC